MVRKAKSAETPDAVAQDPRSKIVAALMALAATREFAGITIHEIAVEAGVSLADFREAFPSKGAILASFARQIDLAVLRGSGEDMAEESAKDRLFDVLMRRLDAMGPYKTALAAIMHWVRRDPAAAIALNGVALNSMRFMLEAANLSSETPAGGLKLQGLVLAWSRVLAIWVKEEDVGHPKTMAALDKELARGAILVARADDFARLTAPFRTLCDSLFNARRDGLRRRERWAPQAGAHEAPAN